METLIFILILFIFLVVAEFVVIILGYKWIRFIMNRHFRVLEGLEATRNSLVNLEVGILDFSVNPLIRTEPEYRRIPDLLKASKDVLEQFEEFYQSIPESKEKT